MNVDGGRRATKNISRSDRGRIPQATAEPAGPLRLFVDFTCSRIQEIAKTGGSSDSRPILGSWARKKRQMSLSMPFP